VDYAHLVTPQKIRLSRHVNLVPQTGHYMPILSLAFEPQSSVLAALDATPCVRLWTLDPPEVLLIAPIAVDTVSTVSWLPDQRIVVSQRRQDETTYWSRPPAGGERWRVAVNEAELFEGAQRGPHVVQTKKGISLVREDGTQFPIPKTSKVIKFALDPLLRYVATIQGSRLVTYDLEGGRVLRDLDVHSVEINDLALSSTGQWILSADKSGLLLRTDPLREERSKVVRRMPSEATAVAVDPTDEFVAVGDVTGQVSFLSLEDGGRLFATPKGVREFEGELPLLEDVGYVGLRGENFTAYLEPNHSILPVRPLPAPAVSYCPGLEFPLLNVALDDGQVFEVDLSNETLSQRARAPWPLTRMAVSEYGVVGVGEGGIWSFDGDDEEIRPCNGVVLAVAINRAGDLEAFAYADRVEVRSTRGKGKLSTLQAPDIIGMAFSTFKSKETLVVVDQGRVLWRWDLDNERLVRIGVVEPEPGLAPITQVLSLHSDADGTIRGLAKGENDHRFIVAFDLVTATARLLLGIVVVGRQIAATYDSEGTWLRQDEERSVRVIQDLQALNIKEWSRSADMGYV